MVSVCVTIYYGTPADLTSKLTVHTVGILLVVIGVCHFLLHGTDWGGHR